MLKEPAEFDTALSSLFTAQQQAIQARSAAGGEHLCFIGMSYYNLMAYSL